MDFILNKMRPTKNLPGGATDPETHQIPSRVMETLPLAALSSDPLPPTPPTLLPGQRSTTNSATSQPDREAASPPSSHGDKEQLCEHCDMASDTDTTPEIRASRKKGETKTTNLTYHV